MRPNVIDITVRGTTPVLATDITRSGLTVATPITISRPASDGMATSSITPPNNTITTAITPAA